MKKAYLIYVILGLAVVSIIIAFKNNDKKDMPVTKENLAGSYRLTEVTSREEGKVEHSIYNLYLNDCEKDDVVQLNNDFSSAHLDEGNTCNPLGMESGKWDLPGNNSIEIEGSTGTITKFNGNTLSIVVNDKDSGSSPIITLTYSRFR